MMQPDLSMLVSGRNKCRHPSRPPWSSEAKGTWPPAGLMVVATKSGKTALSQTEEKCSRDISGNGSKGHEDTKQDWDALGVVRGGVA